MNKLDFIELASYCQKVYKEAHNSNTNRYVDTLYVSINGDEVLTSNTPHILQNAEKCILIHKRDTLAVNNFYYWYKVEYIDNNGCVSDGMLEDGFRIDIISSNGFSNQIMRLLLNDTELYSCRGTWSKEIVKVWKLYTKLKSIKTEKEIKLIADLFRKDEKILELEKQIENFKYSNELLRQERDQYRSLLNDIKELIHSGKG